MNRAATLGRRCGVNTMTSPLTNLSAMSPARNAKNVPGPYERPAPAPRQEQPTKAFIPSLMLGGVSLAPKPAPAKPAPKAEEPKGSPAVAAAAAATGPALGNLD